jgi:FRG domain
MSSLMPSPAETFRAVFEQIFFPHLAVDLARLRSALREDPKASTSIAIPLGGVEGDRRTVLASSMGGMLVKLTVPEEVIAIIASSAPIQGAGLAQAFLEMAHSVGNYAVLELGDELVWREESLWPVAYSTLFEQLVGILEVPGPEFESIIVTAAGPTRLSDYARNMPTHLHYAVASLAAWLAGADNFQYFAYFATQPQLSQSHINCNYAAQIGYTPDDAAELNESGIVALPASLVLPLLTAQGAQLPVLGTLPIDERNVANLPDESFHSAPGLPGFVIDKYYRAPFRARPLEGYGCYGAHDVLRDHYQAFYDNLEPVSHVRCKHYTAPVLEVGSIDEIHDLLGRIPIHEEPGPFLRGQPRLFTLQRTDGVRRLLFADSCAVEPSLTTSASRRAGYDYDRLHFALRFFLELKLLAASDAADGWQAALASPACELDYALMALAQHYGLPSHGLDITTNPEVAVWFATNLLEIGDGRAGYTAMSADDWPEHVDDWPVAFVHQAVTHPLRGSLHDCHELDAFGFGALRPERQSARFFLGGHSDHQNRIAESVVCVLRLRPADYETGVSFDHLFPSPDEDAGYQVMLEFAEFAGLTSDIGVLRFHQ